MWTNKEQEAMKFAEKAHEGQKRKTGEPYITHPIDVAAILKKEKLKNEIVTEELIVAGFLHDTIEDTDVHIDEIKEKFGEHVCSLVKSNTEDKDKTWLERKTETQKKIFDQKKEMTYLLLADKMSNLKSMLKEKEEKGEVDWSKFKNGYEEQRWYHIGIMQIAIYVLKDKKPYFLEEMEVIVEKVFDKNN